MPRHARGTHTRATHLSVPAGGSTIHTRGVLTSNSTPLKHDSSKKAAPQSSSIHAVIPSSAILLKNASDATISASKKAMARRMATSTGA